MGVRIAGIDDREPGLDWFRLLTSQLESIVGQLQSSREKMQSRMLFLKRKGISKNCEMLIEIDGLSG